MACLVRFSFMIQVEAAREQLQEAEATRVRDSEWNAQTETNACIVQHPAHECFHPHTFPQDRYLRILQECYDRSRTQLAHSQSIGLSGLEGAFVAAGWLGIQFPELSGSLNYLEVSSKCIWQLPRDRPCCSPLTTIHLYDCSIKWNSGTPRQYIHCGKICVIKLPTCA